MEFRKTDLARMTLAHPERLAGHRMHMNSPENKENPRKVKPFASAA
jgi:hypothetical protein